MKNNRDLIGSREKDKELLRNKDSKKCKEEKS